MSQPRTLSQQLGDFAVGVKYADLPSESVASVRNRVLDTLGISLAAVPVATSKMAFELVKLWGQSEQSTAIGLSHRLPSSSAAFVNGVLAHTLDFDDTHLPSVLHPSATVVPTALAVAEATNSSSEDLIAAAAAGYEVCIRTGMAGYDSNLGNSVFFENGWHATSICGSLAAAVIAAKLYGLDAQGITNALGIAVSMASGVLEANRTGGSVKRIHCGWAAHAGIMAAQAARAGFTAPPSILEGRFGFYRAFCNDRFDGSEITRGLGTEWNVTGVSYKPYPANHFTHAAIDAALKLRKMLRLDDILDIELRVATPTLRTIAEPRESKAHPQSGYHAQFSGPFAVAAALIGGGGLGVWLDDFTDENVHDQRYLTLAAKVRCISDPECDAIFPEQLPAILRVTTHDRTFEEKVLTNRGGPLNPLKQEELLHKFMVNASRTLSAAASDKLSTMIENMENLPVTQIMHFVASALGSSVAS